MPYGFNDDKSRYDLQTDLDRISALEAAAGFDPSVFDERFENIEDDIDSIESSLGIGSSKGANKFYAAPSNGAGQPSFRKIAKADLPPLATTDISGLGVRSEYFIDTYALTSSTSLWQYIGGTERNLVPVNLSPGVYFATASVTFPKNPNGFRRVCISPRNTNSPNGTDVSRFCVTVGSPGMNIHTQIVVPAFFVLNEDTPVNVWAQQNSGVDFYSGEVKCALRVLRIR